jgi:hypothetical protein
MQDEQKVEDMVPECLRPNVKRSSNDVAIVIIWMVIGIAMLYAFDWAISYSLNRWGGI